MKVVIIEDEKITAEDLVSCIAEVRKDYEVVKILGSVKTATKYFEENTDFDLIFSDIQLSDGVSFEIYKNLQIQVPVIFCTAYDNFSLEAFKTNGIAYVLKPFSTPNIAEAIDKFELLTKKKDNSLNDLLAYFENNNPNSSIAKSILIHQNDKIIPLNIDKIGLINLENGIIKLHTIAGKIFVSSQTLEEFEKMNLPYFYRVNRQIILNRNIIKDVSQYFNRKLLINISLEFSEHILVSKEKSPAFLSWLANS
ncbi:LytR/AlgR family response regulator transcription factor [Lacihabitans lacunae]|uniref:LytR/AlgR family response regulator transcription factor n=1 Tax=Lacihabitans lacunae TaxID=1028214 RepID=A0ABV7YVL6_9BACT